MHAVSDTELRLKTAFPAAVAEKHADSTQAASFKCTPHVDQSEMISMVVEKLASGECVGIFPEGGSHDRPEFLPLKAGFTMMALQTLAKEPSLGLKIIPCGLNYFHPDKFRSRAVLEYGEPISVPSELVEMFKLGGDRKREACSQLLDLTYQSLKAITVNAPDYDTLMVLVAARRLYKPENVKLKLNHVLAITRHLAIVFPFVYYID